MDERRFVLGLGWDFSGDVFGAIRCIKGVSVVFFEDVFNDSEGKVY